MFISKHDLFFTVFQLFIQSLFSVWAFRQLEEIHLRERPDSYYCDWKWDSRMWCQYQNLTPGFEATKPLWRPCRHLQPQTYLRWNILALQLINGCCSSEGSEYLPTTKVAVPGSMTSIDIFESSHRFSSSVSSTQQGFPSVYISNITCWDLLLLFLCVQVAQI